MNRPSLRRGRGYALVTALILLLILAAMSVVALSLGTMQTRVAANAGNALVSFEVAEGALTSAESQLLSGSYSDFAGNANGLYTMNPGTAPIWTTVDWTGGGAIKAPYSGNAGAPAYYLIEQLPSVSAPGQSAASQQYGGGAPRVRVFRITARAVGANGKTPTLLQSLFHD